LNWHRIYDNVKGKMRTSPYSLDLRERVIKFIESGNSQKSAVELYKLNPSTISRWWHRYKSEGHYAPRIRLGKKPRVSLEKLKLYIEINPNFKTSDMGKHFGMSGSGAFYWLKQLGFSYKKKALPTWKLIKKSEISTKKL
jgi:transposase